MKSLLSKAVLLFCFCVGTETHIQAQQLVAETGSYGIDAKQKLVVWHEAHLRALTGKNTTATQLEFLGETPFKVALKDLSYSKSTSVAVNGETYRLYVSKLPMVSLRIDTFHLKNYKKRPGTLIYFRNGTYLKQTLGARYRGNLSLSFPKKSFDLEFWKDSISKQKTDVSFKEMRTDDDWILDAMYNEPLRLRSYVASNLWLAIHEPYYKKKEPQAKSGFEVLYVDLFLNGNYHGIYALSEGIDRKQLQLKANEGRQVYGELFKADAYEGAPDFKKAPAYNTIFPHWGGFEMSYPTVDYKAHWDDVAACVDFVINSSDAAFSKGIAEKIHIDNAIDYFLFVNLLRATDNLGKNYYLARYDKDEPYFFVPWDLDGVFGIILEGRRIATTNDILTNGLFKRLLELNPENYRSKMKLRWEALRQTAYSTPHLWEAMTQIYEQFMEEGIYEREFTVWPKTTTTESDYHYLKTWLNERLAYLDASFKAL